MMTLKFKNIFILIFVVTISFILMSCSTVPNDPYYKKSPVAHTFNYQSNQPFSAYVSNTKKYLEKNRVYFDDSNKTKEIEMVTPFELKPRESCDSLDQRGILLVHGLSDTAFVMKDLANKLSQQCLLVRTILLPGHGTRPKDLIDVHYSDWIKAVDYGINSLKKEVNEVYIAGFSLGGLLAANAAIDHKEIKGAILVAPALGVGKPMLTWNTKWLRHVKDWLDIDPQSKEPRYKSMPTNGVAQTYMLTQYFNMRLSKLKKLETPIILIQSMEDAAIQPELNLNIFKQYMTNPKSVALVYSGNVKSIDQFPRLNLVNSHLPDSKIVNFSHLALLYAPENKTYGTNGSYKACGLDIGIIPTKQAEDCINSDNNWKGEFSKGITGKYYPFQRLTYNPLFDSMVDRIDSFLITL